MSFGKYGIFAESLVIAILIVLLGFFLGLFVEIYREKGVAENYKAFEIEALDLKLQNYYYQIMDSSSCAEAINQNFIFADNLYNEGLKIDKYEKSSQITSSIELEKKRYVLLKTELWLNSILLKEKCNNPFDTLVYVYMNDKNDNAKKTEQDVISNILGSIKSGKGDKVVLLPLAGDLGLKSVELQMRIHNVTYFPSIIINEDKVLEGFHTEEEISSYLEA